MSNNHIYITTTETTTPITPINSSNNVSQIITSLFNNNIFLSQSNNENNNSVSEEFLNNLEELEITEEMIKSDLECSICLDKFKLGEKYIKLPCNDTPHIFHVGTENCSGIKPWLERNNTCPMCRCEFETDDIQSHPQINSTNTFSSIFNIQDNSVDISDNNIINDSEDYITNITEMIINEVQTIRDEERNFQRAIELSLEDVE